MDESDALLLVGPGRPVDIGLAAEQDAPFLGRMNACKALISVDLPAPFSPSKASTSPASRCSDTSRRAVVPPKRLVMCSKLSRRSAKLFPPVPASLPDARMLSITS